MKIDKKLIITIIIVILYTLTIIIANTLLVKNKYTNKIKEIKSTKCVTEQDIVLEHKRKMFVLQRERTKIETDALEKRLNAERENFIRESKAKYYNER